MINSKENSNCSTFTGAEMILHIEEKLEKLVATHRHSCILMKGIIYITIGFL